MLWLLNFYFKVYFCLHVIPCHTFQQIRDLKTDKFLPAYGKGEICMSGGFLMKGYLNNKEATDAMISPDGWLRTGDIGYYDSKGYLYVVDRLKEIVKYKGLQVSYSCLYLKCYNNYLTCEYNGK